MVPDCQYDELAYSRDSGESVDCKMGQASVKVMESKVEQ